jgi:hypothetical protein
VSTVPEKVNFRKAQFEKVRAKKLAKRSLDYRHSAQSPIICNLTNAFCLLSNSVD